MVGITNWQNKTPPPKQERNERLSDASEPVVPIPSVVVPVDVHVALAAVAVEDRVALCEISSVPPPLEYSQGCTVFLVFGISNAPIFHTKYLHFL